MGKCVIVMNDVALKAMYFSSQNDTVFISHNFFFNTIFQKNLPPATSGVLLAISKCGAEGGTQGTVTVSVTGARAWKPIKSRNHFLPYVCSTSSDIRALSRVFTSFERPLWLVPGAEGIVGVGGGLFGALGRLYFLPSNSELL